MENPKAVIADDEETLVAGLKIMLNRLWPTLEICGEAYNGPQALELIKKTTPDIAFLDIKMPGLTGVEVAEQVYTQCKIVFITAFDNYAVEAFESEAIDYVLKPVTETRLQKSIERLQKQLSFQKEVPGFDIKIEKIIKILENRDIPENLRLIKVKNGSEIRFIPVTEVFFFKAEDKYTIVQTLQKDFLINTPIKDLEKQLDPKQFWRVHRNSIVNIEKIKSIKRSFTNQMTIVFEKMDNTVPVSRSYENLFKQM